MPCTFTPAFCRIDLAALRRNFRRLGPPEELMPVIKSDAYGHGLLPVAAALADAGALRFAVGTASEGLALRRAGFGQEIVPLMGCLTPEDWRMAVLSGLTPLIAGFDDIAAAAAAARACGAGVLPVALKCDSGMGRLGFTPDAAPDKVERLRAHPVLAPRFALSHLSSVDMPGEDAYTDMQAGRFGRFLEALGDIFPGILPSLGNSAATIGPARGRSGICRPGLALYGGNPFAGTEREPMGSGLEWAMSVAAPILAVHPLRAGESLSYGRIFTAPRDMRVAVVAAGYATGYARALSGRVSLLVRGRRAPQVGRVCMSMLMLDVSELPEVAAGDLAWVLGGPAEPGERPVDAQELAQLLDTIPYEILCLMGGLNPRVYA